MTREEAKAFIAAIVAMRNSATDEQALKYVDIYPSWKPDIIYDSDTAEKRVCVKHNGVLYKCYQGHTSKIGWEPNITPALWVAISFEEGTKNKPIIATRGMEYEEGKYYFDADDNMTYICIRSGILQYMPHELIGHYFNKI